LELYKIIDYFSIFFQVHLDEETLMTESAILGILDFCQQGTCDFGHGLVVYKNDYSNISRFTPITDFQMVAMNGGKERLVFDLFKKALYTWRGAFVVSRYGAERKVSYDHGQESCWTEDCYFALNV